MNIKITEKQNYVIVEPSGDLALGSASCIIHDQVRELLDKKKNHIIVDMGKVLYINSVCISALIGGFISTRNAGGELKLANMTEKVKTILHVTKLNLVFNLYSTVDDAVKSFGETVTS